jgi:hypothetical protein
MLSQPLGSPPTGVDYTGNRVDATAVLASDVLDALSHEAAGDDDRPRVYSRDAAAGGRRETPRWYPTLISIGHRQGTR